VLALRKGPILDVGAAQGMLGRQLQGSGLVLDAVELNPVWADECKPFYRNVYNCPIEAASLEPKTYRVVVCGDVLEHTVDPVSVLRQTMAVATDDATFVVSLPNVAHLAVRLMLLFGSFPKMERGILDRTHLHFFTRRTMTQMLREAGLRVTSARATGVPLDELWRGGEGRLLFKLLTRSQHLALTLAPRLFAYQWVMTAERLPTAGR
jgi:2-polyprenyl-3-methyl-5-hydroxy-6-metoxy-1,4-benzoquinol methylase